MLTVLAEGGLAQRVMTDVWRRAGTVGVVRREPAPTVASRCCRSCAQALDVFGQVEKDLPLVLGAVMMRPMRRALAPCAAVTIAAVLVSAATAATAPTYRVSRVIDGDTLELTNGERVRLVQIDTPEVYSGYECYGQQASAVAKRLLPVGSWVELQLEPASDPVDRYGRLLRYVIRANDGLNVNLRLVAVGAAAPWFYDGERGRYTATLGTLVKQARAKRLGLWGACPRTVYDPYSAVTTRP